MNNDHNISDEQLLHECLDGKPRAWEMFYQRFHGLVSWTVWNTANFDLKPEAKEDCAQFIWESLVEKDYHRLRIWEKKCSLSTWIKRCSCSLTINWITNHRHLFMEISVDENDPPHEDIDQLTEKLNYKLDRSKLFMKVTNVIEKELPARDRLFVKLYWYDELTYEEISRIMKISQDNLYIIRHRVIEKIRHILDAI